MHGHWLVFWNLMIDETVLSFEHELKYCAFTCIYIDMYKYYYSVHIYIYKYICDICIAAHSDIKDARFCLCCPWKKSITSLACLVAENWALLPAPRELWMLEELASLDTLHVSASMAASCSTDQHVISAIWWIFQRFSEIVPPKFCVKTTRCEVCQRS